MAKCSGDNFNWERKLDNISLSDLHDKRKCHILIVVENTTNDLEKLLMIRYHAESDSQHCIKFISMNDIYDFIISYETKKLYVDDVLMMIIAGACGQARRYLQKGKDLPHDLLGKIIKLKIVTMITVDVHQRKQEIIRMLYEEQRIEELHSSTKRRKIRDSVKVPFRELYILLIQFYSPKVISGCCRSGVIINGIVEFGEKDKNTPECMDRTSDIFRDEFWKKAPRKYYQQQRLEEPFRLVYRPAPFKVFKGNPHIYTNQCSKLYEDFAKSIDTETIKSMKNKFLQYFDIDKLLKAEVKGSNRGSKERIYQLQARLKQPILSNMSSTVGPATAASTSTTVEWSQHTPKIKRVDNELDIDGRMRYSKWPGSSDY